MPGPWFNIKMTSYQYKKYDCGDKTILRPSYLHSGISYTGKMTIFNWSGALVNTRMTLYDYTTARDHGPWTRRMTWDQASGHKDMLLTLEQLDDFFLDLNFRFVFTSRVAIFHIWSGTIGMVSVLWMQLVWFFGPSASVSTILTTPDYTFRYLN